MLACGDTPRYILHGTAGSLVKYGGDVQEPQLRNEGLTIDHPSYGIEPKDASHTATLTTCRGVEVVDVEVGNYRDFFRRLAGALRGDGPLPTSAKEGLVMMLLLEAAVHSAETGTRVDFHV